MALQFQLFKGDPKLEAAAASHPAHIAPGARGPHVVKIQQALNVILSLSLGPDKVYGQGTAAAVLQYKRQRNIVNTTYQTEADNIVGIMTMTALDADMLTREGAADTASLRFPALLWRQARPRRA
jgi:peptidoglycan hydrolase-like protein with peptidoglycan-binding domain